MRFSRIQLLSIAASIVGGPFAHAHSQARNPISAVSNLQNATIHTHNGRVTALSHFDLTFNLRDDLHVKFNLEPNHDILGEDATVQYMAPDGTITRTEKIDRLDHKVFLGNAWISRPGKGEDDWQLAGWSRVMVHQDGRQPVFEGAFSVDHDHHHIQSSTNYARTKHTYDPAIEPVAAGEDEYMVVWRDSDILPQSSSFSHVDLRRSEGLESPACIADELAFNQNPDHPVYLGMKKREDSYLGSMDFSQLFAKRQLDTVTGGNGAGVNLVSSIGSTAGCPTTRKIALVGVATDCTYTKSFNSTDSVKKNALAQMNQASAVWERTFNISLAVQNIVVSDAVCPGTPAQATYWNQPCSDSFDISQRLNWFSQWRGGQQDANSHWTLLSTCNSGPAVGLSWLGQACVRSVQNTTISTGVGWETSSGANVVVRYQGSSEWQVIAHETGHMYGAVHDCDSSACANKNFVASQQCCQLSSSQCDAGARYIMNPSAGEGITDFSLCTVGNICSALGRNSVNGSCLVNNRQVNLMSDPICGNGIVEAGEDCDCGGTEACANDKCCNPSTCKFTTGSVCDDANEDCCRNCQLASAGTVCRASTGVCDPQETCSGSSASCPADITAPDGDSCGASGAGLECASGQCTSRDQQCKSVMGVYTQTNDTYSCPGAERACVITCASPDFGFNTCQSLAQNFLDGTSCGGGGRCYNGQCKGSSWTKEAADWINDHKAVVIGIAVPLGVILLLAIFGCIGRCFSRRRVRKQVSPPPRPPPSGWQGWQGGPYPPMQQQQRRPTGGFQPHPQSPAYPSQGWFNQGGPGPERSPAGMNGPYAPPPIPPPSYSPRGPSARWA